MDISFVPAFFCGNVKTAREGGFPVSAETSRKNIPFLLVFLFGERGRKRRDGRNVRFASSIARNEKTHRLAVRAGAAVIADAGRPDRPVVAGRRRRSPAARGRLMAMIPAMARLPVVMIAVMVVVSRIRTDVPRTDVEEDVIGPAAAVGIAVDVARLTVPGIVGDHDGAAGRRREREYGQENETPRAYARGIS